MIRYLQIYKIVHLIKFLAFTPMMMMMMMMDDDDDDVE